MNYLLDRKNKRRKVWIISSLTIGALVLFYFRSGIFNNFSSWSHTIFRPVMVFGNKFGGAFSGIRGIFVNKSSLEREIENLKQELEKEKAKTSNYDPLLAENVIFKEILGRNLGSNNFILSAILSKPNQSPYDTIIIDVGAESGVKIGNTVFAFGSIPVGRVAEAYSNSSKVVLFSSAGEKTQVIVGPENVFMQIVGRGGGNFEMTTPLDFPIERGEEVTFPGIMPYVVAVVQEIISDPRDAARKTLLVSPLNIQELKFVEVERR